MWTAPSCSRVYIIIVMKKFVKLELSLCHLHISNNKASWFSVVISTDIPTYSLHRNTGEFYLRNQPIGICDLRCLRLWMLFVPSELWRRTSWQIWADISEEPSDGPVDGHSTCYEKSVNIYQSVRRHIPQESNLRQINGVASYWLID